MKGQFQCSGSVTLAHGAVSVRENLPFVNVDAVVKQYATVFGKVCHGERLREFDHTHHGVLLVAIYGYCVFAVNYHGNPDFSPATVGVSFEIPLESAVSVFVRTSGNQ